MWRKMQMFLDGLRRPWFDGAFIHNIFDDYYLKPFQK